MKLEEIHTYQDFAYVSHDQNDFLRGALKEFQIMIENHFMTKRNKALMAEKKELVS